MHNFFTPKEFTPLGGLASKNLMNSQGFARCESERSIKDQWEQFVVVL